MPWVYMQFETYTTELFLPGTWLLYPASFFLVRCVTGFILPAQMKLNGEDVDVKLSEGDMLQLMLGSRSELAVVT